MTATVRPADYIATGRDPPKRVHPHLGSHRRRSSVSETEVEEFACVGIYSVCACFNVVDALRPAVKEQPAPSKPIIPISTTHINYTVRIAQMYICVKKACLQILVAIFHLSPFDTPDPRLYTRQRLRKT